MTEAKTKFEDLSKEEQQTILANAQYFIDREYVTDKTVHDLAREMHQRSLIVGDITWDMVNADPSTHNSQI